MGNILVTGGTGFVGQHLCNKLKQLGHNVIVFSSKPNHSTRGYFIWDGKEDVYVNLSCYNPIFPTRLLAQFQPHFIYHLAAISSNQACKSNGFVDNINMTHNLLRYIEEAKLERPPTLFYMSSGDVVGDRWSWHHPQPKSLYATSKLTGEYLVKIAQENKVIDSYTIMRPCAIVGKGMTHGIVPDVIKKLSVDSPTLKLYGKSPGTYRGYLHINDLLNMLLPYALTHNSEISIGNNTISSLDVATQIMITLDKEKEIIWSGESWPGDRPIVYVEDNISVTKMNSLQAINATAEEYRNE